MYRAHMKTGERFLNYSAGGSGWGNPVNRDKAASEYDRRNGYVTADGSSANHLAVADRIVTVGSGNKGS
jgi:N-methylhydantoinase B/oxoprolinase/acetone carboxylase alpha subunit